ncbi:Iron(III)-hydroxamate import system permease protein fhuB [Serratia fonticola]|uniref:Iron(III)-hydroxamate import system permease protein fhuB n=1 Tax=Serratia fonticola TaxID=47917 RepID=A0A4U9WC40_SERFO|nr:Iron(III)-hydroxamate import system permease protein fhuB [Serratia fonticola]
MGGATARSVGIALTPTRLSILLLAATLTAMATLTVGPLSFIGLMAPHMARMLGFRRALPQMVIAALLGGLLMVFADWCGRMVMFPYQIPAGLLATFIGAPYFVYLLRKQNFVDYFGLPPLPPRLSIAGPLFFQAVTMHCVALRKVGI